MTRTHLEAFRDANRSGVIAAYIAGDEIECSGYDNRWHRCLHKELNNHPNFFDPDLMWRVARKPKEFWVVIDEDGNLSYENGGLRSWVTRPQEVLGFTPILMRQVDE